MAHRRKRQKIKYLKNNIVEDRQQGLNLVESTLQRTALIQNSKHNGKRRPNSNNKFQIKRNVEIVMEELETKPSQIKKMVKRQKCLRKDDQDETRTTEIIQ